MGGPTRAKKELGRVPGIRYGSWSRFSSPFNFGQTRLRGFVKLTRQTSNRGVGNKAEADHVGTLCRFSGWAPGTATGPSAMRGPFHTPYTHTEVATWIDWETDRGQIRPGHDPSALPDHPTSRHDGGVQVARSRIVTDFPQARASAQWFPVTTPAHLAGVSRPPSDGATVTGVIGSSRSQGFARPMFLSWPIPTTAFDSCRCVRPPDGRGVKLGLHHSRGSTPDVCSSQLQSCALQNKWRGCKNRVGVFPDSAHRLTQYTARPHHQPAGVIDYRPLEN
jgi:hypothetical protein